MDSKSEYEKKPAQVPVETERTRNRRVYVPKVDIIETGEAMVMYADMPGVHEKSVEVTLEKNVLKITGAVESRAFPGRSIAYAEYDVGDYERAFTVSDEIDRERIGAVMKNGVLKIALHKAPQAGVIKITVRTE
jgi:HSP20 family molecular chaperone IbpA